MEDSTKSTVVHENGVPYRPQPSPRSINLNKSDAESSLPSSTINSSSGDLDANSSSTEFHDADEILSGSLTIDNGETDLEVSSRESIGFNVSGLNVTVIEVSDNKSRGDGSDSGVESTPVFHRAFSCGYSSGGFDDLNKSCDSSLLSYSEDTELMTQSLTLFARDGTSEGGSESSVLDSDAIPKTPGADRKSAVKKKVVSKSNRSTPVSSLTTDANNSHVTRRQNITPRRFNSASTKKPEKEMSPVPKADKNFVAAPKVRSISNLESRSQNKFKDTLASVAKKPSSASVKPKIAAKPNFSTSTTPRTKTSIATEYDGRWPSSSNRTPTPSKPRVATDTKTPLSKTNNVENSKVFDRFGTLPRRSRKRSPETCKDSVRSFSMNRDTSITRTRTNVRDISKTMPPFPRRKTPKTRIYHEISVQTALTSADVEKALEGICIKEPRLDSIETKDQEIQVDTSIEVVKKLESKLKGLEDENNQLTESVKLQKESLNTLGEQLAGEIAAKESIKEELSKTDSRLLVMLGKCKEDGGSDSLQELETHLQSSGQIVIRQQKEIFHLQTINRTLQRDLDKSLATKKEILKQQQEAEAESQEMQEFLLAEKSFLADELRNAEAEVALQIKNVAQKVSEFERKKEECNHLVRISEQRRQENLTLQGRLNGLDQRSKDLLLQQGAAVSGASVALSGLSTRLEGLVDQLVVSYDISEKDLEDVIFHNEAYSKSNGSSAIASPEKTLNFHQPNPSPQRRASFLTAVVRAIRNATNQTPFSSKKIEQEEKEQPVDTPVEEVSQAEEVKDPSPTTDSSEEGQSASSMANSESLHNLSQAILRRKQFENGTEDLDSIECDGNNESMPELDDFAHGPTFIDQIIAVDNLVTKLLKILRIIQLENDTNVDELQDERVQLEAEVRREQDMRRSTLEEMRSQELVAARLRGEVQEAKLLLQRRVEELEQTKSELQFHREQVRTLTTDNWKLSAAQRQLQNCDDEAKGVLQKWQETGEMPSPDSVAWIVSARDEIPALKQQLAEKEMQLEEMGHKFSANKDLLTQNLHQAANEIRRQYEAIDNALEILHSIQGVVVQCPPLAKLQRDLEETNFDCASSQPIVAADLNANAAPMSLNEIHNGGLDAVVTNSANPMSGEAY